MLEIPYLVFALFFSLVFSFFLFLIYNGLITLRNNTEKAFANIDVLLKKRSDLIPNLVKVVDAYAKHERKVLTEITTLRTSLMRSRTLAEKARASERISEDLEMIFAVSENYPKLRANKHFLDLQNQLTKIEGKIADRREFYNDSVYLYNVRIRTFPDMVLARILDFRSKEYFKAKEGKSARARSA